MTDQMEGPENGNIRKLANNDTVYQIY